VQERCGSTGPWNLLLWHHDRSLNMCSISIAKLYVCQMKVLTKYYNLTAIKTKRLSWFWCEIASKSYLLHEGWQTTGTSYTLDMDCYMCWQWSQVFLYLDLESQGNSVIHKLVSIRNFLVLLSVSTMNAEKYDHLEEENWKRIQHIILLISKGGRENVSHLCPAQQPAYLTNYFTSLTWYIPVFLWCL
jgi:hypothetical protein